MLTKAEVLADTDEYKSAVSLSKLSRKKVVDIEGFLSAEFGASTIVFKISAVVFEGGEKFFADGEHDIPYLTDLPDLDQSDLCELYKEWEED